MYGFNFDPEVPAGYQDADLEMLELEERARYLEDIEREERAEARAKIAASPEAQRWHGGYATTPGEPLEEPAPTLELDTGQLALRADVVERNGQQVFEELARPAKPAPLTFERDTTEELARRQLEELTRETPEALERMGAMPAARRKATEILEKQRAALPPVAELGLEELRAIVRSGPENRLNWTSRQKEAWSEIVNREQQPTAAAARTYSCACCGRELEPDHYVYSRHTRSRFCWPGEGCQSPQEG